MSQAELTEGAIFAGRYQIIRCIARGGMGAVYEVCHIETRRRHALKVMLPHILQSEELREKFRLEARVAAHIVSEYIVDVSDAGFDETTQMPFLVMELLQGEELGTLLRRVGRISAQEAVTYIYQIALGLDKTHRSNIVHRDLKLANIFLTTREDGQPRVKILDFGIAKVINDGASQAHVTSTLGTPLFMAPEQFQVGKGVSPMTDVYALGMIAYNMLVGAIYWHDESVVISNVYEFIAIGVQGPQEPASYRAARKGVHLPPAFDDWFARATARSPHDRFPSAGEAARALATALGVALPGRSSVFQSRDSFTSQPDSVSNEQETASSMQRPEVNSNNFVRLSSRTGSSMSVTGAIRHRAPPLIAISGLIACVVLGSFVAWATFSRRTIAVPERAAPQPAPADAASSGVGLGAVPSVVPADKPDVQPMSSGNVPSNEARTAPAPAASPSGLAAAGAPPTGKTVSVNPRARPASSTSRAPAANQPSHDTTPAPTSSAPPKPVYSRY
ncbi:protein kinase [Sorangium sp. So ce118]